MKRTFFQAIDDRATTRRGLTFEAWLDAAKAEFMRGIGNERYAYEASAAFYPASVNDVVPFWDACCSSDAYATQRLSLVRPPVDML